VTTVTLWIDAAYAPTPAQAQAAFSLGARGCGFYLPGEQAPTEDPLNTWTPAQVQILRDAGLRAVPIWVPAPNLPADPIQSATRAFTAAKSCGCNPLMSGLYTGNHLETSGQISGPIWIPAPGAEPASVGSQSAIQWGQTNLGTWSVDENIAASDFPWEQVIMVDFEYNTIAGQQGIDWYKKFQQQIAALAKGTPVTPSPIPLQNVKIVSGWGYTTTGTDHVYLVSDQGHTYHFYYSRVAPTGWFGPEMLS
jgi:hypothetical protein